MGKFELVATLDPNSFGACVYSDQIDLSLARKRPEQSFIVLCDLFWNAIAHYCTTTYLFEQIYCLRLSLALLVMFFSSEFSQTLLFLAPCIFDRIDS